MQSGNAFRCKPHASSNLKHKPWARVAVPEPSLQDLFKRLDQAKAPDSLAASVSFQCLEKVISDITGRIFGAGEVLGFLSDCRAGTWRASLSLLGSW